VRKIIPLRKPIKNTAGEELSELVLHNEAPLDSEALQNVMVEFRLRHNSAGTAVMLGDDRYVMLLLARLNHCTIEVINTIDPPAYYIAMGAAWEMLGE